MPRPGAARPIRQRSLPPIQGPAARPTQPSRYSLVPRPSLAGRIPDTTQAIRPLRPRSRASRTPSAPPVFLCERRWARSGPAPVPPAPSAPRPRSLGCAESVPPEHEKARLVLPGLSPVPFRAGFFCRRPRQPLRSPGRAGPPARARGSSCGLPAPARCSAGRSRRPGRPGCPGRHDRPSSPHAGRRPARP